MCGVGFFVYLFIRKYILPKYKNQHSKSKDSDLQTEKEEVIYEDNKGEVKENLMKDNTKDSVKKKNTKKNKKT